MPKTAFPAFLKSVFAHTHLVLQWCKIINLLSPYLIDDANSCVYFKAIIKYRICAGQNPLAGLGDAVQKKFEIV